MLPSHQLDTESARHFFAPITDLYSQSALQYRCTDISDISNIYYCQLGVLRRLSSSASG